MGRGGGTQMENLLEVIELTDKIKSFETKRKEKVALIAVDVQNDFLPGGALGVPGGDQVVEPLKKAAETADFVVASRDWHPENHVSFIEQGGIWPVHCVANDKGSALHPEIEAIADNIVDKGVDSNKEAYSAFDGTGLASLLRAKGIKKVIIGGLATDYCVKATALDAAKAGFKTTVLKGASRGVNVKEGDTEAALAEVRNKGVEVE